MVTTASSAGPQSHHPNNNNNNNHPSSSSSSMAHHHLHREDDDVEDEERENPKLTKLPQRSRTSHITSSKFTTSSSSSILPKFSSLPCFTVQWGRQFRCVTRKPTRSDDTTTNNDDDDGGILAMREKLMLDFRTQVQQIHADFIHHTHSHQINHHHHHHHHNLNNNNNNDTSANNDNNDDGVGADKRPWNLRTRRAVCKDPNGGAGGCVERKHTSSPVKVAEPTQSPLKSNGVNNGDAEVLPTSSSRTRRKKFSASLSKKEIDEDFIAMGAWPAKRPKKRPKLVQRQIDGVFPGYWLSEITAKMYKVNEHP